MQVTSFSILKKKKVSDTAFPVHFLNLGGVFTVKELFLSLSTDHTKSNEVFC